MSASVKSIRSAAAVAEAAALIRAGELVIVPTDTIYGIVTLPLDEATIDRFYRVRRRKPEPALPFLISGIDQMVKLTRTTPTALRLARRFWPGPLTLILPPAAEISAIMRAYPIAVRVPNYPPLLPLMEAVGGYLLTTGAILSGYPPAITAKEAADLFDEGIAMILDGGPAPYGVPSTIVDCVPDPPVIVRRGTLPENKIWHALDIEAPNPSVAYR
ncbi:MAG: L-threonylcarbamoyladenylate synthase [Anaerolineae bacterium]